MKIPADKLAAQHQRAQRDWPFIDELEHLHGLPRCLLYAVGSRETNLTDETGDGGHGHGVWQLDNRSHQIPDPFPVTLQAEIAATMLAGLIHTFGGDLMAAVCAYNAGAGAVAHQLARDHDPNAVTAGGDYGRDVLERAAYLAQLADRAVSSTSTTDRPRIDQEEDVPPAFQINDPETGGSWFVRQSDGATYSDRGEPVIPGLNAHPEFNAVRADNPVVSAAAWKNDAGQWGIVIVTQDARDNDSLHFFHFDRNGQPA